MTESKSVSESLDCVVEQFESDWTPHRSIKDFLPDQSDPCYGEVFCELVRVDMELRWTSGESCGLETYLKRFPNHGLTQSERSEIAFEEYRLRRQNGESVDPTDFAETYGIKVTDWPKIANGEVPEPGNHSFPQPGDLFHDFKLVGLLGTGAFGQVYLAQQGDLANRFVVIKVTEVNDAEPQALARLQHTNIVPIHSMKREGNLQSICMPFLGLITLRDILGMSNQDGRVTQSGKQLISTIAGKRASTVSGTIAEHSDAKSNVLRKEYQRDLVNLEGMSYQDMILWMAGRIADGLAYSHLRGVVHGDLKPGNILIADDGQPLILDFHLSGQDRRRSESSLVGGTLPYMSVKHLRSLERNTGVDESCDIFSLGVIMFESLTGQLPFPNRGNESFAINEMIRDRFGTPKSVRSLNPSVGPAIGSIVDTCLSPASKYQNADQVRIDIERHQANLPLRFASNPSVGERFQKWTRRHPKLSSVSAMLMFGMVAIAALGFLVKSKLDKAASVEATIESNDFIAEMEAAKYPLTVGGAEISLLEEQGASLNGLIDNYLHDDVTFAARRSNLSSSQVEKETAAILESEYWLARSYYVTALNSYSAKRRQLLNMAVSELDESRTLVGTAPELLELQSKIEFELGNKQRSQELLVESGELQSSNVYLKKLYKASDLRVAGQYSDALVLLDELVHSNPVDYQVWLMKGHTHRQLKNVSDAIASYTVCVGLDVDSAWGFYFRGLAHLESRNFKAAKADFDAALDRKEIATSRLNRALALQGMGNYVAAIDDATKAIEHGCGETRAYYVRHRLLAKTGNRARAQKDLTTFLELTPNDEKSWLSRGMAHMQVKQPDKALEDFQAALRINPKSTMAFENIAAVQAEFLNETPKAIDALTKIIEQEADNVVAIATRGVLFARISKRAQAIADAKLAMSTKPSSDTFYRVAGIYALTSKTNMEDKQIAIRLLRLAAFMSGKSVFDRLESDSDLDPVRGTSEFKELVANLTKWKSGE